jgi:misacylated tRNA(Ala) deacylase
MTVQLYKTDAYQRQCAAKVLDVDTRAGIILDQTVFYAAAGGQPGDAGALELDTGDVCPITTTLYAPDKSTIYHMARAGGPLPTPGQSVRAFLDWGARHKLMRMHTCLHLLCALVKFPVTGGQIGGEESRLDFDIEDASSVDKDLLTASLNALIAADHPVSERWITDEDLALNPALVRTMSVRPPTGSGKVRLVVIGKDGAVDVQPCGGTHVKSTSEIGSVAVSKIEKKGKLNRRIRVAFA